MSATTMKFCPTCHNMFYVKVTTAPRPTTTTTTTPTTLAPTLRYYCRQCKTDDVEASSCQLVLNADDFVYGRMGASAAASASANANGGGGGGGGVASEVPRKEKKYFHMVNDYMIHDTTLPRLRNVPCPNAQCPTFGDPQKQLDNEVVYVRYDDENLKYMYICSQCLAKWKTDDVNF